MFVYCYYTNIFKNDFFKIIRACFFKYDMQCLMIVSSFIVYFSYIIYFQDLFN